MRVKNMLLAVTLAALTLAGCSDEVLVEGNDSSGDVQVTRIAFSSGSVSTKANSADPEGYQYTTKDELYIDNLFVAAFFTDGETVGEQIDYFAGDFNDPRITSSEDGSFTLSGLVLPFKQGVKLVAIANLLATNTYVGMSYEQLIRETVSYSALGGEGYYTFAPKSLIKVGELDFKLDANGGYTTLDGTALESPVVTLKQLAAKIQLYLKIQLLESSESVTTTTDWNIGGYSFDEVGKALNKDLMTSAKESSDDMIDKSQVIVYPDHNSGKLISAIYGEATDKQRKQAIAVAYGMSESGGHKYAILRAMDNGDIGHITMKKIQADYKSVFYLKKMNIWNVEKKSALLSPVGAGIQGGQPGNISTEMNKPITDMSLTLYTYEKPKYESADKESALIVNPVGQATSGVVITTTTYSVAGDKLRLDWGEGNGWGNGSASFSLASLIIKGEPVEETALDEGVSVDPAQNKSYKVYINPSLAAEPPCTDGLLPGNYYYVAGRLLAPAPDIDVNLAWQVMPWSGRHTINIGMN